MSSFVFALPAWSASDGLAYRLETASQDADAAVFRSSDGRSNLVRSGERVGDTEYVLVALLATGVVVRAPRTIDGRELVVELRAGDALPTAAMVAPPTLIPAPHVSILQSETSASTVKPRD